MRITQVMTKVTKTKQDMIISKKCQKLIPQSNIRLENIGEERGREEQRLENHRRML